MNKRREYQIGWATIDELNLLEQDVQNWAAEGYKIIHFNSVPGFDGDEMGCKPYHVVVMERKVTAHEGSG